MIRYSEINENNISDLAKIYVESFNSEPWNDKWSLTTAEKRLHQIINSQDFYGILAHENNSLCGMIMGNKEQFYDGVIFNIKEFCIKNSLRGNGLGSKIFEEFEDRLRKIGIKRIILFTTKGISTEHFYHKQGLETYENSILMGKEL